jgi:hypothetical protein
MRAAMPDLAVPPAPTLLDRTRRPRLRADDEETE